jgi:hypothetical protein
LQPEGFDWQKHRNLSEHSIVNPANGANIVGYSATGDVARGGRKTVFALDEFATFNPGEDYAALNSTSHVTNARFLVSTYKGDSGAYYEAATEDNNAVKIVLDWRDNPTQNRQLYRVVMGRIAEAYPERDGRLMPRDLEVIRYQHQQLKRRGFVVENRLRNVWYNQQCLRPGSTPRGIAQELDRDPRGAESKVFNGEIVKQAIAECARPPLVQGRLVVDMEQAEVRAPQVVAQDDGEFQLWTPIGLNGQVPVGLYVVGVDVSAGTGNDFSSNSAAVVVNRLTGEQVAQWTSNTYPQQRFAHVVVALARWFHEALVIPEANFASAFMTTMLETIGYQKVWRRNTEVVGFKKLTQKYGFWMKDDDLKLKLFEVLQAAIAQRAFVPRSREMLNELHEYSWKNGKIIHVGSTKTDDEGSKGRAHGDRVIATCLAWHVCAEDPHLAERAEQEVIMVPPGSMAARLKEFDELYLSVGSDPWQEGRLDIFTPTAVTCGDDWG